jgi:hypothetical protein
MLNAQCARMDDELPSDVGYVLVFAREAGTNHEEGFSIQSNLREDSAVELTQLAATHMADIRPGRIPKPGEKN